MGEQKSAPPVFVAEEDISTVHRSGKRPAQPRAGEAGEPTRGTVVGEALELRRLLGEGAKGKVFEAFDLVVEREVAVKLAHGPSADGERSSLRDEARALGRVRHPAFPAVLQAGSWAGRDFVAEELVKGAPLASHLGARRQSGLPFGLGEALGLLASLSEGLSALHQGGSAHGNVTTDNVLLTPERRPVLTGLTPPSPSRPRLARTPVSPAVLSLPPEVLLGIDEPGGAPAADVYALGALAFELVAGQRAFAAASPAEELDRRTREPAPPVTHFRQEAPAALVALLAEMLDAEPRRRPSAEQARVRLREIERTLGSERSRPATVLIVDPDRESADTLRLCAEWAADGADILVGTTGEWALSAMATRSPDVVLFDVRLPDMSGVELCMVARGNGLDDRCSLVAVGGGASDHDIALLRMLGVREFVPKGSGLLTTLPRLVKALLDERARG